MRRPPPLGAAAPLVLFLTLAAMLAACGPSGPPKQQVVTYVRNGSAAEIGVLARPVTDPPVSMGFSAGMLGVGCNGVPGGSQIVVTDGGVDLTNASGDRLVALIGAQQTGVAQVIWIDVAADGTVTSGPGQPPWWTDPPQAC